MYRKKKAKEAFRDIAGEVGVYYHELALHLFGGERVKFNGGHAPDIRLPGFGNLEIKGRGYGSVGLPTRQIDFHEKEAEISFPDNGCAYILCFYKNRESRQGVARRVLREHQGMHLDAYLSQKTAEVYCLDIAVIQALRERLGERTNYLPGLYKRDLPVMEITRTMLREYFVEQSMSAALAELGLSRRTFSIVRTTVVTEYRRHPMEFPATFVLRREAQKFFAERLRDHPWPIPEEVTYVTETFDWEGSREESRIAAVA